MKFPKGLTVFTVIYYLVNIALVLFAFNEEGGSGFLYAILIVYFQGISLLAIIVLTFIYNKPWLSLEYGRTSLIMILSYLVVPVITLCMMG